MERHFAAELELKQKPLDRLEVSSFKALPSQGLGIGSIAIAADDSSLLRELCEVTILRAYQKFRESHTELCDFAPFSASRFIDSHVVG